MNFCFTIRFGTSRLKAVSMDNWFNASSTLAPSSELGDELILMRASGSMMRNLKIGGPMFRSEHIIIAHPSTHVTWIHGAINTTHAVPIEASYSVPCSEQLPTVHRERGRKMDPTTNVCSALGRASWLGRMGPFVMELLLPAWGGTWSWGGHADLCNKIYFPIFFHRSLSSKSFGA